MALDVNVKIDISKPIGKVGFGFPLLLSVNQTTSATPKDYTICSSLDDVVTAGFEKTTSIYKTAALLFQQNDAPKKIAVIEFVKKESDTDTGYAAAVQEALAEPDWRQLIIMDNTDALKVADVIETTDNRMFFCAVEFDEEKLPKTKYERTVICSFVNNRIGATSTESGACAEAAIVGASAGLDVGSFTYKNLIIKGVEPSDLTDSELAEFNSKNVITVDSKAGDIVTTEGKVVGGEYIDIVDSKDYVVQSLEYKTQKALNTYKKIPYDNNGIAVLESIAIDVMQDSFNKGIIAANSDGTGAYEVSYALVEDVSADDKANRKYIGGKFKFTLAGAIHEVEITGEISI